MKTAVKDFKMTELGPIPKDWEVKRLGDVAPLQRGFDLPTSELEDGPYPVVYSNGIGNYHREAMCDAPGLVTGRSGTIGHFTYIAEGRYWPHNTALWVTSFNGNHPLFIKYLYETLGFENFSTGTGVPTLNRNIVHDYLIPLPPLPEQRKIAAALSDVDEMIAALEKLIEKKRKIKTGAMQRLLIGKTRLPGFEGAWVEKRLGDVFEFHSNNTLSRASMIEGRGQIYNIHYGDVLIRYGAVLDCNKTAIPCLDDAASSVCKRDFLKDGDVIIADTAEDETVGKAVEVINVGDRLIASGLHTIFLRPKEGTFALGWLGYYVNSTAFHDQLLPLITGIKVSSISKGSLMDTVLRCPPTLAEQKAIAKVLGDMDEEIAALEAELAKTRQLKQGMMQELLTGKTRLVQGG